MRKYKEVTDKSTPYRTFGSGMIKAPVKADSNIKSVQNTGKEDLRVRKGK